MIIDFDPTTAGVYFAVAFAVALLIVLPLAASANTEELGQAVAFSFLGGAMWPVALPGLMLWGIAKLVHKLAGRKKDRQTREHEELRKAYHELLAKHRALEEQLPQKRAEGKYR